MKNILLLMLFVTLLSSCSDKRFDYNMDQIYGISDVEALLSKCSIKKVYGEDRGEVLDKEIITGVRKGKLWAGCFEKNTKRLLYEWYGRNIGKYYAANITDYAYEVGQNEYVIPFYDGVNVGMCFADLGDELKILTTENATLFYADNEYLYFVNSRIDPSRVDNYIQDHLVIKRNGEVVMENGVCGDVIGHVNDRYLSYFYILGDNSVKSLVNEVLKDGASKWIFREDAFDRNMSFGYGETKRVESLMLESAIYWHKSWASIYNIYFSSGDACLKKRFLCNGEKYIELNFYGDVFLLDWYKGSVMVLSGYKGLCYNNNLNMLAKVDICKRLDSCHFLYPFSYSNAIMIEEDNVCYISNEASYRIDKLSGFANNSTKYTYSLIGVDGKYIKIHVKAINFDGSKMEFDFSVNIETLEIGYL